jgi:uncharacterized membrane protein YkoI
MKQLIMIAITATALLVPAVVAEKSLKLTDLPPAVQKAVQEQTKGAEIKNIVKEVEKGKTMYEVETVVSGRTRDMMFDTAGAMTNCEEAVGLDSIPAPAKAAIEKKAAGGKITKVEKVTEGKVVSYEAVIDKKGKTSEFAVKPDGSVKK